MRAHRNRLNRLAGVVLLALSLAIGTTAAPAAWGKSASDSAPTASRRFATRYATFVEQRWSDFGLWSEMSGFDEVFRAFVRGCTTLRQRAAWRDTCERAASERPSTPEAARRFFEHAFVPYRVQASDLRDEGLLTGYFEPELAASRERRGRFVHPVYGEPSDLLFLDLRSLPPDWAQRRWLGRIEGRSITPIDASAGASGGAGSVQGALPIEWPERGSEPLDRRLRFRQANGRLVPYHTRQQIEAGRRPASQAIAWVDDPDSLYAMQVQGSGRLRFADGRVVRVGYAEQNGHPFLPRGPEPIAQASGMRTRSIAAGAGGAGGAGGAAIDDARVQAVIDQLLSMEALGGRSTSKGGPRRGSQRESQRDSPRESQRGSQLASSVPALGSAAHAGTASAGAWDVGAGKSGGQPGLDSARVSAFYRRLGSRQRDPSYVFFRELPPGLDGPLGALGVPLTAGRSIAVDPRVTPLGAPAVIQARRSDASDPRARLVVAQDTGGAIRGALRADFFWGGGAHAGLQALRTRDLLAMWVLLPRSFSPPVSHSRSRSIDGAGSAAPGAECTMPDEQYCD